MSANRQLILWTVAGVAPVALFLLMQNGVLPDPSWAVPNLHFFVVSLTSLIALFLAGLIVVAAGQLRDARVIFLSLAFLSISGVFAVHGFTTPGALFAGSNPWVGFSAHLSLFLGAIFFACSAFDQHPRLQDVVVRRQRLITGIFLMALLVYGTVAFVDSARNGVITSEPVAAATSVSGGEYGEYGEYSDHSEHDEYGGYGSDESTEYAAQTESKESNHSYSAGHDHHAALAASAGGTRQPFAFLTSDVVGDSTTLATIILMFAAILHYAGLYRRSPMPMLAGFLLSAIFLLQAQISMSLGTLWMASWWQYHVLMLGAFIVASLGLVIQYGRTGSFQGVVEGLLVRTTVERLQAGYTDVIVALVGAVEAKDLYTRGHTQRVSDLTVRIGQDLGLSPDRLRILGQAAMLHDIGKIGVPDSILNKPGSLTDDEFEIVKQHPMRGYDMVSGIRSLRSSLSGIRHHHERLDGSGYPDGLVGDQISLDARIIAVADVFDALTSQRSYRPAWSVERALGEIEREAGNRLDARCVESLRRLVAGAAPQGVRATAYVPSDELVPVVSGSD